MMNLIVLLITGYSVSSDWQSHGTNFRFIRGYSQQRSLSVHSNFIQFVSGKYWYSIMDTRGLRATRWCFPFPVTSSVKACSVIISDVVQWKFYAEIHHLACMKRFQLSFRRAFHIDIVLKRSVSDYRNTGIRRVVFFATQVAWCVLCKNAR